MPMAHDRHVYAEMTSVPSGSISQQQQQQDLDGFSFDENTFAGADFWPLHDELFDTTGQAPALPFSDILQTSRSPAAIEATDDFVDNPILRTHDPLLCSDHESKVIPQNYGFGYWLSVSSRPGTACIRKKVKSNEFDEIAANLKASWAEQLMLENTPPTSRCEEPTPELAWRYCNAYFEHSVDNLWEIVYRPDFERYLRSHLTGQIQYHDAAWHALRNMVYAAGCRIYRSGFSAADSPDVRKESWGYFSNALSVHSELLLTKPTLRSVRALLTMAFFAEGLVCPALSSGLVSNAALLAQSLSLHRKQTSSDVHQDSEALQQTWLFWAVYCCEKHIAQRCCQPSLINDDDITCPIPTTTHPGSAIDLEILTYIIQTCQLYDQVSKQLLSTRALQEPPAKMLELVRQFDIQLQTWKESMPTPLQPTDTLKQFKMPGTMRLLGLMTIHSSYYDLLMAIHSIFMYPWVLASFSSEADSEVAFRIRAQVTSSSHMVANAARSLIVITRSLDMDSIGTQSFTLHLPMRAFINLFVYVIDNPLLPSVQSDLALLDVAAGYFGQMESVTGSRFSFPFARDIAALARNVVDEAKSTTSDTRSQIFQDMDMNESLTGDAAQHLDMQFTDFDSWLV